MSRNLKVYNSFGELILHLDFVLGDRLPLQAQDGTPEMLALVRALTGRDFDLSVSVGNQQRRFEAKWGTPEYLDALAGYLKSNFSWRTKIIDSTSSLGVTHWAICSANVSAATLSVSYTCAAPSDLVLTIVRSVDHNPQFKPSRESAANIPPSELTIMRPLCEQATQVRR